MQVRSITRSQERRQPLVDGQMSCCRAPPKQRSWNRPEVCMDEIQSHDNDVKCPPLTEPEPSLPVKLGAILSVKKSKTRNRDGEDCGSRATARALEVETAGQEKCKSSPRLQDPSGQACQKLSKGDLLTESLLVTCQASSSP